MFGCYTFVILCFQIDNKLSTADRFLMAFVLPSFFLNSRICLSVYSENYIENDSKLASNLLQQVVLARESF